MANSRMAMAVAMAVFVVAMVASVQPASAQCPSVTSLAGCISAASKGTQPPQACCNAMAAFAQNGTPAGSACLCQAINNPTAKAAGAQLQYAIQIPKKCNLKYKAGYVCNGNYIGLPACTLKFHNSTQSFHFFS